ncbi:phosphoserine aminotransferase apoenzyme [Bowdeniella nasicola]|uniref:phosphoserine transaminase n=1 Tax=Bowdeniella nasicola TaxID=208480 RepID=A0A1H3ZDZ4_9ACTO|nr:phosphoserine aminotransferase apoenzyme [Bowdeniella nasicola]
MDDSGFASVPSILPHDGRFGSGPTRIRPEQLASLSRAPLGTSHRAAPVRSLVGEIRERLGALLNVLAGYEIVLGNGGATLVWEALTFSLVRERAAHAVCGEFGGKFAALTASAPFLADSIIHHAEPGSWVGVSSADDADVLAFAHNETSTGVCSPLDHVGERDADQLVVVDATSIAGAVEVELDGIDAYYFSPQKALGADGGLWFAILSPAAIERISQVRQGRWIPPMLDLGIALENSRKDQTYNTPSVTNLALIADQLRWIEAEGGLGAIERHCRAMSQALYDWADEHPQASPFVASSEYRSPVVATIDLREVDAEAVRAELAERAGIVDIAPYRSLGRNQVRIGTFPSVALSDVEALIAWLTWALSALRS